MRINEVDVQLYFSLSFHAHRLTLSLIKNSDLVLEAELLASLSHPNIIKLRGITYSGSAGFADGPCGYFLVIDRLQETLDQRIKLWRETHIDALRVSTSARSNDALLVGDSVASTHTKKKQALVSRALKKLFIKKSRGAGVVQGTEIIVGEHVKQARDKAMDERLSIGEVFSRWFVSLTVVP